MRLVVMRVAEHWAEIQKVKPLNNRLLNVHSPKRIWQMCVELRLSFARPKPKKDGTKSTCPVVSSRRAPGPKPRLGKSPREE